MKTIKTMNNFDDMNDAFSSPMDAFNEFSTSWNQVVPWSAKDNTTTHFFLTSEIEAAHSYNELVHKLYSADSHEHFVLFINTPGGDMGSAHMICDAIRNSKATVTARLSGSVCSSGTIIVLACDQLEVAENTEFMIHYYSCNNAGKGSEIKQRQAFIDKNMPVIFHRIYDGFLSDDEINRVIEGTDIWLNGDEVRERWKKKKVKAVKQRAQKRPLFH